ncbi:biopolymer transport protein ExbD [Ectothiorhodospira magna]|uniref:Biopolymer transport protein ExbD n=1 Tax=Ectothiorhodospira magna TaxID=867345 RepID=A0A1H9ASN6_9GAMM|nr:biopolymer transporter ExbD [Ectothiorhodospira magna]SEP79766.1 biopolymer transport protein ExbD [Ectothiorhodospira magna]
MQLPEYSGKPPEENLIPLINIVFLLLIFFMVAGALSAQHVFEVEAPDSRHEAGVDDEGWLVLLGRDGRLALDDEEMDADTLKGRLRAQMEARQEVLAKGEPLVRIKADQAASTDALMDLMELLRAAGVEEVRLLTVLAGDR